MSTIPNLFKYGPSESSIKDLLQNEIPSDCIFQHKLSDNTSCTVIRADWFNTWYENLHNSVTTTVNHEISKRDALVYDWSKRFDELLRLHSIDATTTTAGSSHMTDLSWEQRQLAKEHPIPVFNGIPDLEKVMKFIDAVEHLAKLQGRGEREQIDMAWRHFNKETLDWFTLWVNSAFQINSCPPKNEEWPFNWNGFVQAFRRRWVPSYALEKVANDIKALSYSSRNTAEFNKRFQELIKLSGGSIAAQKGSEPYRLYVEKLPKKLQDQLTVLTVAKKGLGTIPTLEDAIAVVQENDALPANNTNATTEHNAPTTAAIDPHGPIPMDLSLVEQLTSNVAALDTSVNALRTTMREETKCSRCGGVGHWTNACPTDRNYKEGDPVNKGAPSKGSGGHKRRKDAQHHPRLHTVVTGGDNDSEMTLAEESGESENEL